MPGAPLVSVITPAFNAARFVEGTIASVRAQTLADWEMIVVDDCSRDDTYEIARRAGAGDPRVQVARMPSNSGSGPTRNEALRRARGKYVAFLDADDLWDAEKLEKQVEFMRSGGHLMGYTSYRVISEDGALLTRIGAVPESQGYADMLKDTVVGCLTVMLDRERLGPLAFPHLRLSQDLAMWLSVLRRGHRAYGLQEELASYRIVSTSATRNKLKSAAAVWKVLREAEKLPLPGSVWYFSNYAVRAAARHVAARLGS